MDSRTYSSSLSLHQPSSTRSLRFCAPTKRRAGHVEAAPSFEIARTRGTRVLLVEDNEINQEVAIGLLEDAADPSRFGREWRDCSPNGAAKRLRRRADGYADACDGRDRGYPSDQV